jgi:hypothetical protein
MARQKVETFPVAEENSNVENFAESVESRPDTKAVVDGWYVVDARLAKAETEQEARDLFVACFRLEPRSIEPANAPATKGESYLYRDEVGPMYGIPSV